MNKFTEVLRVFTEYSEKLDNGKINWGDYVNLQHYLKNIITGYKENNLSENERNSLLEIYYSLGHKTIEFLNKRYK